MAQAKKNPARPSALQHIATKEQQLTFGMQMRARRIQKGFVAAEDMHPRYAAILAFNGFERQIVKPGQLRNYEIARSAPRFPAQVRAIEMTLGVEPGTLSKPLGMDVTLLETPPAGFEYRPDAGDGAVGGEVLRQLAEMRGLLQTAVTRLAELEERVDLIEPARRAPSTSSRKAGPTPPARKSARSR